MLGIRQTYQPSRRCESEEKVYYSWMKQCKWLRPEAVLTGAVLESGSVVIPHRVAPTRATRRPAATLLVSNSLKLGLSRPTQHATGLFRSRKDGSCPNDSIIVFIRFVGFNESTFPSFYDIYSCHFPRIIKAGSFHSDPPRCILHWQALWNRY